MPVHTLPKITTKAKRRLGQGHGSGRVKTSGRGTKGQKARRNIALSFEGGALPLIKRLPFLRGKERNFSYQTKSFPVNVEKLNTLPKGTVVDKKSLVEYRIVSVRTAKNQPVKILGRGKLSVALTVKLPVSQSAKAQIEKAGGRVEINSKSEARNPKQV